MIDHVGFEVSDVARAARFYDAVFFALGVRRMHESERAVAYGVTAPTFWLTARNHPAGSYGHVALRATGKVSPGPARATGRGTTRRTCEIPMGFGSRW